MAILIVGLILFLGIHSVRIFANDWRTRQIARFGEGPWKGVYSVISLAGFLVLLWGFSIARREPIVIWTPPAALRHANALFMLVAFIFLAAAYVPRNTLKARFGHPMLLSVKIWAVGHLLANGTLDDIVLFGAGEIQQLPGAAIRAAFRTRGIALECMSLGAACRTYNILASEARSVLAGLFP